MWQMLHNPKWCLAFTLSVWPLYGLQPLYWAVIFCCIERTDEFQLVNFILEFKALMFFSIGFVCLGIGASLALARTRNPILTLPRTRNPTLTLALTLTLA